MGRAGPGWQCRGETHCPCTGSFHSAGSACGTGLKLHIISSIISDKWHYLRHLLAVVGLRESRWAMTAPWPQPAKVTDPGLPPKSATACCTQSRARATSVSPRLPGSSRVSSERKPSNPVLNKFHRHWNVKEIVRINISSRPVLHCNHHKVLSHQLSSSKLRSSTWSDRHCITSALLFFIISDYVENFDQTISAWLFRQKL